MLKLKRLRNVFVCLALLIAYPICYICGALRGEHDAYRGLCEEYQSALRPILASDPAFSDVSIGAGCSRNYPILTGRLHTRDDFRRLRTQVVRVMGESRAEFAVGFLEVPAWSEDNK